MTFFLFFSAPMPVTSFPLAFHSPGYFHLDGSLPVFFALPARTPVQNRFIPMKRNGRLQAMVIFSSSSPGRPWFFFSSFHETILWLPEALLTALFRRL